MNAHLHVNEKGIPEILGTPEQEPELGRWQLQQDCEGLRLRALAAFNEAVPNCLVFPNL